MPDTHYVIYTDMDGTLIDHNTYSYEAALPALRLLSKRSIPLILCTSKTRAELEVYCEELCIHHPLIPENGGAIFIPENYFDFPFKYDKKINDYQVIELGERYNILRNILKEICFKIDCKVIGFGDMDVEDVCSECGLDIHSAALAKRRDYDEAFRLLSPPEKAAQPVFSSECGLRQYFSQPGQCQGRPQLLSLWPCCWKVQETQQHLFYF